MTSYVARERRAYPRLPLKGSLDLTYRCNFNCLHCWLRISPGSPEKNPELSFNQIREIVDESRSMGCREWSISGGEPMLRPDFPDIFDYITRNSAKYSLNTNGSLITHEIARLMRRPGSKMVAVYGATPDVHDRVTRTRGSFELTMRGIAYLKEAGAGFIVQLIPLRANFHQWGAMVEMAKSLSPHWRVGAAWLFQCSVPGQERRAEIEAQRLDPRDVVLLDPPDPGFEERIREIDPSCCATDGGSKDDRLFAGCVSNRKEFHIDPYGRMSFCAFIKDPALRYDLLQGTFREAWDEFIPSLADRVLGGDEYRLHCGTCEKRSQCRWCSAYAYLETGDYSAPIPYLCEVAAEVESFRKDWQANHCRYFRIAGITIKVESDLDFNSVEFKKELLKFAVDGPGDDNTTIRHYFEIPDIPNKDFGEELYRRPPWAISRKNGTWYYLGIAPEPDDPELHRIAVFNADHTHALIYNTPLAVRYAKEQGFASLSLFPTDQIWLAPLLADRNAVMLHSAAAILNGQGVLFVGHSTAGKSTTVTMLKEAAKRDPKISVEILCDDRNIVRRWKDGWRVHGTWSHGDVADVSPASAPLRAVLFLEQASRNAVLPIDGRMERWKRLLATLVKPLVTAEWWQKELNVLEQMVDEVPHYTMHFDRTGAIVPELIRLIGETESQAVGSGAALCSSSSTEAAE